MLHSQVSSGIWLFFTTTVVCLLLADLLVFHKGSKVLKLKNAILWSIFWIVLALTFNYWFYTQYGLDLGTEFLTGYLVELSLSVDNLFIIFLVFQSFKIDSRYQHRILFWGILGAIVMRGILIVIGVDLIHKFHWIMYVFGATLLYSAYKIIFGEDHDEEFEHRKFAKFLKKVLPMTTHKEGDKFFIREDNKIKATPFFLALLVVEFTDLVFAVDSIPAVLAITEDGFVAFGSNILAILGLRAMYFVIADQIKKLRYLKPGLAVILGFIGVKMLLVDIYKISSVTSLFVILLVLLTAGISSWHASRRK
jgi:tellurite resistance protein TerC